MIRFEMPGRAATSCARDTAVPVWAVAGAAAAETASAAVATATARRCPVYAKRFMYGTLVKIARERRYLRRIRMHPYDLPGRAPRADARPAALARLITR
ncbi:hypothetical protein Cme02nite_05220 [Catellatospora methionotrophica]|uniref:Uncharacterized protein n=1 Tax=Catellatospora methionotrophica TaxID=121620 RepID=A0A8J3LCM7_9ACTN|nr:hypothetical protein Cme02nite_05220 [Catellatospora methionotrophica]